MAGAEGATAGRVLVVEDEEDLASLVQINLELAGYEVIVARDGAAGLAAARAARPDLVLLDVMMPVLDGWRVLERLQTDDELARTPVIMLTALAEERDLIRGHLQGAVRYVTKPFDMQALLDAVAAAIAEPDEAELSERRHRVRALLRRLAELDSGRSADGRVRLSRLESPPGRAAPRVTESDRQKLARLTDKQRYVAERLAAGRNARELAEELGVSRSNVYATRKRIARKLGVDPDTVGREADRLGLGDG